MKSNTKRIAVFLVLVLFAVALTACVDVDYEKQPQETVIPDAPGDYMLENSDGGVTLSGTSTLAELYVTGSATVVGALTTNGGISNPKWNDSVDANNSNIINGGDIDVGYADNISVSGITDGYYFNFAARDVDDTAWVNVGTVMSVDDPYVQFGSVTFMDSGTVSVGGGVVFTNVATPTAIEGMTFYNGTVNCMFTYDGSAWKAHWTY